MTVKEKGGATQLDITLMTLEQAINMTTTAPKGGKDEENDVRSHTVSTPTVHLVLVCLSVLVCHLLCKHAM